VVSLAKNFFEHQAFFYMKTSWRKALLWFLPITIICFFVTRSAHSQSTVNSTNTRIVDKAIEIFNSQIDDLLAKGLLEHTRIVPNPKDAAVSGVSGVENIEWIPVRGNIDEKKGIVTFFWLVEPSGEIGFEGYNLEGDKELVEIVAEVVRDYRFKPNEGSRKYRLVTAKYIFPAR
jgi:hypothetical protein